VGGSPTDSASGFADGVRSSNLSLPVAQLLLARLGGSLALMTDATGSDVVEASFPLVPPDSCDAIATVLVQAVQSRKVPLPALASSVIGLAPSIQPAPSATGAPVHSMPSPGSGDSALVLLQGTSIDGLSTASAMTLVQPPLSDAAASGVFSHRRLETGGPSMRTGAINLGAPAPPVPTGIQHVLMAWSGEDGAHLRATVAADHDRSDAGTGAQVLDMERFARSSFVDNSLRPPPVIIPPAASGPGVATSRSSSAASWQGRTPFLAEDGSTPPRRAAEGAGRAYHASSKGSTGPLDPGAVVSAPAGRAFAPAPTSTASDPRGHGSGADQSGLEVDLTALAASSALADNPGKRGGGRHHPSSAHGLDAWDAARPAIALDVTAQQSQSTDSGDGAPAATAAAAAVTPSKPTKHPSRRDHFPPDADQAPSDPFRGGGLRIAAPPRPPHGGVPAPLAGAGAWTAGGSGASRTAGTPLAVTMGPMMSAGSTGGDVSGPGGSAESHCGLPGAVGHRQPSPLRPSPAAGSDTAGSASSRDFRHPGTSVGGDAAGAIFPSDRAALLPPRSVGLPPLLRDGSGRHALGAQPLAVVVSAGVRVTASPSAKAHATDSDASGPAGGAGVGGGEAARSTQLPHPRPAPPAVVERGRLDAGGAAAPAGAAPPRRRLHVLFADDESSNRKLMARLLKRLGHTFVEVRAQLPCPPASLRS